MIPSWNSASGTHAAADLLNILLDPSLGGAKFRSDEEKGAPLIQFVLVRHAPLKAAWMYSRESGEAERSAAGFQRMPRHLYGLPVIRQLDWILISTRRLITKAFKRAG
jgi:hypothetical protein